MVSLAHKFAYESQWVTAEAVSAVQRRDLAGGYKIVGTPHTVIDGEGHLRGRVREEELLGALLTMG